MSPKCRGCHCSTYCAILDMKLKVSNKIFFSQVEQLITQGETVTIAIKGNSMRPWLRDGREKVILKAHTAENIKIGEIALFRYKGRHILHRIININGNNITFAGDGNIGIYEYGTMQDIIAVVKCIITPKGRIIECDSRIWRVKSRLWLATPLIVRRVILGIARRL